MTSHWNMTFTCELDFVCSRSCSILRSPLLLSLFLVDLLLCCCFVIQLYLLWWFLIYQILYTIETATHSSSHKSCKELWMLIVYCHCTFCLIKAMVTKICKKVSLFFYSSLYIVLTILFLYSSLYVVQTVLCLSTFSPLIFSLQSKFEFPTDEDIEDISDQAKDLLRQLICSANCRFGKNGLDDFKNHPWFGDLDWENVRESEISFDNKFAFLSFALLKLRDIELQVSISLS